MVTLEQIRDFAIERNACIESIMPFCHFLKEGNELECWRIVLEYIDWLEVHGLKLSYKTVHKNAEGMSKRYHNIYDNDFTVPKICRSVERDKNGALNGKNIDYNFDGGKMMETEYLNGEENGIRIYYDVDGNIYLRYRYINGQRVCGLLE